MLRLLLIHNDGQINRIVKESLENQGYEVAQAVNGKEGLYYDLKQFHLILVDSELSDMYYLDLLKTIKRVAPQSAAIVLIPSGKLSDYQKASEVMDCDYLEKPFSLFALHLLIEKISGKTSVRQSVSVVTETTSAIPFITGNSPEMIQLQKQLNALAGKNDPTLLIGEKGVGKTAIAHYIHQQSPRSNKPLIEVDLTALPLMLQKTELFGAEANNVNQGKIAQAVGGALLLKDAARLTPENQTKLLQALENQYDCRVLAASDDSIKQALANKTFDRELYQRIGKKTLAIPALRKRRSDIVAVASLFIHQFAKQTHTHPKPFSPEVERYLTFNNWFGNVVELEATLKEAFLLSSGATITLDCFRKRGHDSIEQFLEEKLSLYMHNIKRIGNFNLYDTVISEVERALIALVLKETQGNQLKASQLLNITRNTLRNRIEYFNIPVEDYKNR
jgi:DNA-binding NtrC family response regulator